MYQNNFDQGWPEHNFTSSEYLWMFQNSIGTVNQSILAGHSSQAYYLIKAHNNLLTQGFVSAIVSNQFLCRTVNMLLTV